MNYKLIKLYPGLNININIGDIAHKCVSSNCYYIRDKEFAGMNLDKFPEFWEEIIEKDYEILSFIHDGSHGVPKGYVINIKNGWLDSVDQKLPESHYLNSSCWKISSVKRLSDCEVFKIGDKLDGWDVSTSISLFRVRDNFLEVGLRDVGVVSLSACKRKKLPLFTTEDGVVVYENDTAWYVDLSENPVEVIKTVVKQYHKYTNRTDGVYLHLFSTEELASKFAEENKSQYSKKDMISFGRYLGTPMDYLERDFSTWKK